MERRYDPLALMIFGASVANHPAVAKTRDVKFAARDLLHVSCSRIFNFLRRARSCVQQ